MTQDLEDAILRLKAEIIAQDWRLSPKRAAQLESAFAFLREHFASRKPIHAMLVMATNVLNYIKTRGASPPETIDFLKEAMAHVVNLHEELNDDPAREEALFRTLYTRFSVLKEKIQHKSGVQLPKAISTPARQPDLAAAGFTPLDAAMPDEPGEPAEELATIATLCAEFQTALARTGPIGAQLATLFACWLESSSVSVVRNGLPPDQRQTAEPPIRQQPQGIVTPCPPTPVKIVTLSGGNIAVQSNAVALVRGITQNMAALYLQSLTVPLKDFARFLQKLSSQFSGSLSMVDDRTLQGLSLPVMIPQGHELPEAPSAESRSLIILSSGNRHGIVACDAVEERDRSMTQFAKHQNGDIAGTAYLDDGETFPLLDPFSMLQREGILLIRE